jgi:hypothetical protein
MARNTAERHDQLLRELNEERAAALTRISRTLESLIGQLVAARERLGRAVGEGRTAQLAAYRELRRQAHTYRWYLEVQREALGFRQHRLLDDFYVIPGPIEE